MKKKNHKRCKICGLIWHNEVVVAKLGSIWVCEYCHAWKESNDTTNPTI